MKLLGSSIGILAMLLSTTTVFANGASPFGCDTSGDPAWTETIPGWTEVIDNGTETQTVIEHQIKVVGHTPGTNGWDGQAQACWRPGSDRVWRGPAMASGECLPAQSLTGTVTSPVMKEVAVEKEIEVELPDTIIEHPDEYIEHESTETHRYYVALPHGGKVYVGQTHDGACP